MAKASHLIVAHDIAIRDGGPVEPPSYYSVGERGSFPGGVYNVVKLN
jgi:hypothetical protein